MISSSQITPGMTILVGKNIFRVESCLVVNTQKGSPFVKTKLRDLRNDKISEKNFKLNQEIQDILQSDQVQNIINSSVSKEEAQGTINAFLK